MFYGFMCRLNSSVNYIIQGTLVTSLRYTSRIRKHWCSLLNDNVDKKLTVINVYMPCDNNNAHEVNPAYQTEIDTIEYLASRSRPNNVVTW